MKLGGRRLTPSEPNKNVRRRVTRNAVRCIPYGTRIARYATRSAMFSVFDGRQLCVEDQGRVYSGLFLEDPCFRPAIGDLPSFERKIMPWA